MHGHKMWTQFIGFCTFNNSEAKVISESISSSLQTEGDVSEGGLIELTNMHERLLEKYEIEINNDSENLKRFSSSFLFNIDFLLGNNTGWENIGGTETAFILVSKLMTNIHKNGDLYFDFFSLKATLILESASQIGEIMVQQNFTYMGSNMYTSYEFNKVLPDEDYVFKVAGDQFDSAEIIIPNQFFQIFDSSTFKAIGTSFFLNQSDAKRFPVSFISANQEIVTGDDFRLLPAMVDFEIFKILPHDLPENSSITIIFWHHRLVSNQKRVCVYWQLEQLQWSTDGCRIIETDNSSDNSTTCLCNHLTNFALIYGEASNENVVQEALSQVVSGISVGLLALTQTFIHYFRPIYTLKRLVELNRNYCLLMSLTIFMFLIDLGVIVQDGLTCHLVALLTHFLWLSVFAWTALEGYILYKALVIVFDSGSHRRLPLFMFGYGLPILISVSTFILATLVLDGRDYMRHDICWLGDKFIWAFKGPVAIVLVFNAIVLTYSLKANLKAMNSRQLEALSKVKGCMRFCLVLSFLLGITWLVDFVYSNLISQYIFIILNSSSGIFIFCHTVIFDQKLMKAMKKVFQETSTYMIGMKSI